MAELWTFLCLDIGKFTEKEIIIEMNKAFWTIVKEATFVARFVDLDHQNRNFTVSKMVVSIILQC